MALLRDRLGELKSSLEMNESELNSLSKFDELFFHKEILRGFSSLEDFFELLLFIAFIILFAAGFSIIPFGIVFGWFTPWKFEYGALVLPIFFILILIKNFLIIKKTNPLIFSRIRELKKLIREEELELKKLAEEIAKLKADESNAERLILQKMPDYWKGLRGKKLEVAVCRMLSDLGYKTSLTKSSGDGGIDVIAIKGDETFLIQCKGWAKPAGSPVVRDMGGVAAAHNGKGVVISPNGFTKEALLFSEKSGIELWDGHKLVWMASRSSI